MLEYLILRNPVNVLYCILSSISIIEHSTADVTHLCYLILGRLKTTISIDFLHLLLNDSPIHPLSVGRITDKSDKNKDLSMKEIRCMRFLMFLSYF